MRFSFVHAADLHLDSPFRALPADARQRRIFQEATFRAFRNVVDVCLAEKAAFLLLAGDLYDAKDRSVRARLFLREQLSRLDQAGIQTFIVHGNHDPLSKDAAAVGFPPSVKVFPERWEEAVVERNGQVLARVQGISFPQEKVTSDLSRHFRREGPEFTVGLLHCNLGSVGVHANYAPCTSTDLDERGLDYWALGHVHTRSEVLLPGGGVAVYPGNIQGRHANEAGERGCVVVEVDREDGRCAWRFVPTDVVRFHRVEVPVDGVDTVDALLDRAVEAVSAVAVAGFDAHAVRVSLTGRGPLHAELAEGSAREEWERAFSEALAGASPPVVLEAVELKTRPSLDLASVSEAGGLAADVLSAKSLLERSPALLAELFEGGDVAAVEGALRRAGVKHSLRPEAEALLEEAALRAVELLLSEEGAR